jgi:hypothetical protein
MKSAVTSVLLFQILIVFGFYYTGVKSCNYSLDYITSKMKGQPAQAHWGAKGFCYIVGSPTLIPQGTGLFISGVLE